MGSTSDCRSSTQREVRGPVTSRSCSWILYKFLSAPFHRSLPLLFSGSIASGSKVVAFTASQSGTGNSLRIASWSLSANNLLNCLSRYFCTDRGSFQLSGSITSSSNSRNFCASSSSSELTILAPAPALIQLVALFRVILDCALNWWSYWSGYLVGCQLLRSWL